MKPEIESRTNRLRVNSVKSYKKLLAALSLVVLGMSFSGCALFKKNKCMECPHWSKQHMERPVPDSEKA